VARTRPFRAGIIEAYRRTATLWVLIPALVLMAVFVVLFEVTGRMVAPGGADPLVLQKAFTAERFARAVGAWGDGVAQFKANLVTLDFAFPLVYAVGLASLVALAGGPSPGWFRLWLFAFPGAAAALDWVENLGHLWLLADVHTAADAAAATYPGPLVFTASLAAMAKFALLLGAAAGAVGYAVRRRRWWAAAVGLGLLGAFSPVLWA
jgi:hypothetical protein